MKLLRLTLSVAAVVLLITAAALCESGSPVVLDASVPESFMDDTSLTEVVISKDSAGIGARAFKGCSNLTSVTLPYGVWDIGEDAFEGCENLTIYGIDMKYEKDQRHSNYAKAYGIPFVDRRKTGADGIEYIIDEGECLITGYHGDSVTIDIPSELEGCPVTRIAQEAFDEYDKMYSDGPVTRLKAVSVPGSVRSIDEYAFQCCTNLESIWLEEGLETIRTHSFYYCTSLTSIRIPASVYEINGNPFVACYALSDLSIAEGGNSFNVMDGVLYNAEGTRLICCLPAQSGELSIPSGVRCIAEEALNSCDRLTAVRIPSTVTTIEDKAFWFCFALEEIFLPVSVERIEQNPIAYCTKLQHLEVSPDNPWFQAVDGALYDREMKRLISGPQTAPDVFVVPESVTGLGAHAFEGSGISRAILPEGLQVIGENTFNGCAVLSDVNIPSTVVRLGDEAFCGCQELASISIPDGITEIPDGIFEDCQNLGRADIPASVHRIGSKAFSGCSSLKWLVVPPELESLAEDAFAGCDSLTLYGEAGSLAERYAADHGIPFSTGNESAAEAAQYTTLQKGDRNEAVAELQRRLIELGFLSGKADGDYGRKTVDAVSRFQASVNLEATGVADPETQAALFSDTAG